MKSNYNTSFTLICQFISKFHTYITIDNTNKRYCDEILELALKEAKEFKKAVISDKLFDNDSFINTNKGELFKIHNILVGPTKDLYMSQKTKSNARACYDVIFNAINLKQPKRRFATLPTDLCQEFCKGITYFSHDEPFHERPFYHRDDSCGTGTKTAKDKFSKVNTNTREYVKKCYLERLIYDSIYTNTFHQQDLGHMQELRTMELLYQKYFDMSTIMIHITYEGMIYPIQLKVVYLNRDSTITETYTKNKRTKFVTCKRMEGDVHSEKVQSFDQESAWMPRA